MDADHQHHRRSIRREGYDYRDGGMYYVTICSNKRECIFGEIQNGVMGLNTWGSIVADELQKTPMLRPYVTLDTWIIMPNHVHVIVYMDDPQYRGMQSPERRGMARHAPTTVYANTPINETTMKFAVPVDDTTHERHFGKPLAGSLSTIIGSFKSAATKRINELRNAQGEPIWQRNYYEHIIRSSEELDRIRSYILHNPRNWLNDDEYIDSFPVYE